MIVNFKKQSRPLSLFKTDKKVFVRYRMDGCKYCIESQAEWDALMKKINTEYTVPLGIDIVEVNSNVAEKLGLKDEDVAAGYPSYAIVENGGRTVKKLEPPISAFEAVMRTNGIIVKRGGRTRRTRKRRRTRRYRRAAR
jgi:hypothetical protein